MTQHIAIVTGANRGLGLAACRELARRGHKVVLTARNGEDAESAAAVLRGEGLDVMAARLDVSSDRSVADFDRHVVRKLERVDVLVNNAGAIFEPKGARGTGEVEPAVLTAAFETNTLGAYRLTRMLLPRMNQAGYGRVVNVSSGMGGITEMGGGSPAYRVSKAALNALTRIFHAEARGDVKVNSVCPGWVQTDMGGRSATRTLEEGVAGIVWAATLPADGPSGGFFRDGKPIAF